LKRPREGAGVEAGGGAGTEAGAGADAGGGEWVAVKVQRPGLGPVVALDAHVLRWFAAAAGSASRSTSDLQGVVDQLVGRIVEVVVW